MPLGAETSQDASQCAWLRRDGNGDISFLWDFFLILSSTELVAKPLNQYYKLYKLTLFSSTFVGLAASLSICPSRLPCLGV